MIDFRALEQRLRPFVARHVRCEADVDDVIQDVFLRLQRGLGELRDEERFVPWLYRVTRSALVDRQRRTKREVLTPSACEATTALAPEVEAEAVLARAVGPFVAMLPSPYRETLTLTELEGIPYAQAAEMLGVSLTCVKSRVQRGRRQLRAALEQCCHIALDARGHVIDCEPRESASRWCRC